MLGSIVSGVIGIGQDYLKGVTEHNSYLICSNIDLTIVLIVYLTKT